MRRIELTDTEVNQLVSLMDSGVKAVGLSVATTAAILLTKIQQSEEFEPPKPAKPAKAKD